MRTSVINCFFVYLLYNICLDSFCCKKWASCFLNPHYVYLATVAAIFYCILFHFASYMIFFICGHLSDNVITYSRLSKMNTRTQVIVVLILLYLNDRVQFSSTIAVYLSVGSKVCLSTCSVAFQNHDAPNSNTSAAEQEFKFKG